MTLPVEIQFNRRQWRQLRWFLTGMFLVVGFVSGLIGGRSWGEALTFAACLASAGGIFFWLLGCRAERRSYLFCSGGVWLRNAGRDEEFVPVESIISVRPWPLEVRLTGGRKLKFHLAREEMLEARAALAQILAAAGRPNLIPDFP
jgi:hypothetical protein